MTTPLLEGLTPGGRFAQWRAPTDVEYLVSDVDGTLLGTAALASDEVVGAVERAHRAGVRIGLATGRMRDAVTELRAQLSTTGPHLLHNGAEVVDDDDAVLVEWALSDEQVASLLTIAADHRDGVLEIYTRHGFVASSTDRRARPHWELLGVRPRAIVTDASQLAGTLVLKATFTAFSDEAAASMLSAATTAGLNAGSAVSPHTPTLTYVNITHPEADKGRSLTAVMSRLGIASEHVVAIGDAENDLPMLAVAGTAIAMGQASPQVRGAAHLVVPTVATDGVTAAFDAAVSWRTGPPRPQPAGTGMSGAWPAST